jgi:ABC-2 type transport system ATP-binding protein
MLAVEGLIRRYGARTAVDGLSLRIARGECLGLLGPNGAGKTSTLAMIAGIARPDAGTVWLDDAPAGTGIADLRHRVGLVPQDLALFDELTAWANLQLFGGLYGLDGATLRQRATEALELVGLAERRDDRVKSFSGGMKRRLNIAGALLHDPDLILLDEPTVGVDPQSRNAIFGNLEQLKARGKALLYTTHYMEEAERLCDRVLIMDHGKVLADDTTAALKAAHGNLEQAFLHLTGRDLRDAPDGEAA